MLQQISLLKGRLALLHEQRDSAIREYDATSAAINIAEQAKPAFKLLKDATEAQATRLYSELLTSIIHDVMQAHDQRIELTTDVQRGKTTLSIDTYKDGYKESVDDARGGSVTNLLAAGLRFISLIQSCNRRFVILDEAECWLEPHLVPRFVHVIERLCDQIGVQCLMISHHASDVLASDSSRVVVLNRTAGQLSASIVRRESLAAALNLADSVDDEYKSLAAEQSVGIKRLTLQNVQSHELTDFELGPGLTVLTGSNDIGKSAVARMLRALLENRFRDDLIRHEQNTLSASITVEGDCQLTWTFFRKGKVALYQYVDSSGTILQEAEAEASCVPAFVHEVLAMAPINGIDPHIGDQKDPLFILHPMVTPTKRAEMLNLGDEFRQLQTMMSIHNSDLRDQKRQIKSLISKVNDWNDAISKLAPLALLEEAHAVIAADLHDDIVNLESLFAELTKASATTNLTRAVSALNDIVYVELEPQHDEIGAFILLPKHSCVQATAALLSQLIDNTSKLAVLDEHNELHAELLKGSGSVAQYSAALKALESLTSGTSQLQALDIAPEVDGFHLLLERQHLLEKELDELYSERDTLKGNHDWELCSACGQALPDTENGHHAEHSQPSHVHGAQVMVVRHVTTDKQEILNALRW